VQVNRSLQGDSDALESLRLRNHASLANILLSRGATPTETEDLLADLWSDCVPGSDDRPSLLEKFSGKCSIQGWLATVATNRWIDLKRKLARRLEVSDQTPGDGLGDPVENLPAPTASQTENTQVDLLRDSLKAAFARCPADAMVLLRLVYLHGLTQRELVTMLGWSESKVSRLLSGSMAQIEKDTLKEVKKRDPWLELTWQDFVDMCQTHQIGFL